MGVTAGQQVSSRVLTVPNVISLLRLLLVPVFAVLIVRGDDVWALLVLAVSGASDWLDGVLARRLNQVSRLGQMLDPPPTVSSSSSPSSGSRGATSCPCGSSSRSSRATSSSRASCRCSPATATGRCP